MVRIFCITPAADVENLFAVAWIGPIGNCVSNLRKRCLLYSSINLRQLCNRLCVIYQHANSSLPTRVLTMLSILRIRRRTVGVEFSTEAQVIQLKPSNRGVAENLPG